MGNLNKVMLIGRLGKDPEKRVTGTGTSVTTLTIATSDNWVDQTGQKQERTEWHRVVLWSKLADIAEQYLRKGSQVYIEGRLQTREWSDKDGNKRYTTEIVAQGMQFLDSKSTGNSQYQEAPMGRPAQTQTGGNQFGQGGFQQHQEPPMQSPGPGNPNEDFIEDDIPF